MGETAGSQFFHGMEPIFLRRSLWTPSGLPELIRQGCDIFMPECGDAMPYRSRLSMRMGVLGVLEGLP